MTPNDREALILAHAPLVSNWASRYKDSAAKQGITYSDLLQAGWLGFCQGFKRWNPESGVTCGAFLGKWVFGQIHRLCCPKSPKPTPISLDCLGIPVYCRHQSHEQVAELADWIARLPGTASRFAAKRLSEGECPNSVRWKLGLTKTQFAALLLSLRHHWQANQGMGNGK